MKYISINQAKLPVQGSLEFQGQERRASLYAESFAVLVTGWIMQHICMYTDVGKSTCVYSIELSAIAVGRDL